MVYRRNGKNTVRGVIRASETATSANITAIFIAFQLIVFHAGDAQFPHLLVLAYRGLRKPAPANKQNPEGKSKESHSHKDDRNYQDFQHNVCKDSIFVLYFCPGTNNGSTYAGGAFAENIL
jgi:hypothetical protein